MTEKFVIITGDMVNSHNIPYETKETFIKVFENNIIDLKYHFNISDVYKYYIFRGDSFQLEIPINSEILKILIYIRAKFKLFHHDIDVRLGIGIGKLEYRSVNLAESDGEVFRYAGEALDKTYKMKTRMIAKTDSDEFDEYWNSYMNLLDIIIQSWTQRQSHIIALHMEGNTQVKIANLTAMSQSAVSQHINDSDWKRIEAYSLNVFNYSIQKYFGK